MATRYALQGGGLIKEAGGKEFGMADNENDAVAVEFTIDAGGVL